MTQRRMALDLALLRDAYKIEAEDCRRYPTRGAWARALMEEMEMTAFEKTMSSCERLTDEDRRSLNRLYSLAIAEGQGAEVVCHVVRLTERMAVLEEEVVRLRERVEGME